MTEPKKNFLNHHYLAKYVTPPDWDLKLKFIPRWTHTHIPAAKQLKMCISVLVQAICYFQIVQSFRYTTLFEYIILEPIIGSLFQIGNSFFFFFQNLDGNFFNNLENSNSKLEFLKKQSLCRSIYM